MFNKILMIGIIGQGFVGNAVYQKFKQYYDIKTFDLNESLRNSDEETTYKNEVVFVCLPTPMKSDGSCDTSIVEGAIKKVAEYGVCKTVVIKSTVSPGATARINSLYPNMDVVFNPEFLTERNAVKDYENQNRIILGGPRPSTTRLKQIFSKVFPKAHIIKTDSTHAEMVKYLTNTFLSVKVSFANEIYQLCEGLKIDYDKVVEYATYDKRLGDSHWSVPGHDGDFGFGGHCFPKDLSALIYLTDVLETTNNVLTATMDTNDKVRKNRDWEKMKGRAVS
jgi:nucleotide sugar dehydrogenase